MASPFLGRYARDEPWHDEREISDGAFPRNRFERKSTN